MNLKETIEYTKAHLAENFRMLKSAKKYLSEWNETIIETNKDINETEKLLDTLKSIK